MIVPSVELRKKIMKDGKKSNDVSPKFGEVWYDPMLGESYVVISKRMRNSVIFIRWMSTVWDGDDIEVHIASCEQDRFVRKLSSLEKELL